MTKKQADQMLLKQLETLNTKTKSAKDTEEHLRIVDGMLKIYSIVSGVNGFENEEFPNSQSDTIS